MHFRTRLCYLAVAAALLFSGTLARPAAQARPQMPSVPLHLTATAQDLDRGLQTPLVITVDRWSSDQVRDKLLNTLMTSGPEKLLDSLRAAPRVGSIRTPTSLAWDLHFARATPGEDGGTTIILGTDRPITFSEQWSSSRTLDYPFTIIELHVNNDGEGEGTLSFATKIIPDKENGTIVLENWGSQRTRLTQVRKESTD